MLGSGFLGSGQEDLPDDYNGDKLKKNHLLNLRTLSPFFCSPIGFKKGIVGREAQNKS